MTKYYVVVASLDHVQAAVAGGFIQANHGKRGPMTQLKAGDGIVCYAPRKTFGGTDAYQRFCALGEVAEGEAYIGEMGDKDFQPYRRDVVYATGLRHADVHPLIDQLAFITNPKKWGFPFMRGFFAISETDFNRIKTAMQYAA